MKKYSVFASEGGYKVHMCDYGDDNTYDVNATKWFPTEAEATYMALFYKRFEPGEEYFSSDALNDGYTIHYIDDHDAPEFNDCSPDDYIVICNDIPYYVTTDRDSKIVGLLTADEIEEFLPNSEAFAAWMRGLK
jgi:hypothetical protein